MRRWEFQSRPSVKLNLIGQRLESFCSRGRQNTSIYMPIMLKSSLILATVLIFATLPGTEIISSAATPLVNHGDSWRYHKGTNAPQADWKTVSDAGLDATWAVGNGGFGYSTDNPGETVDCQTILSDMQNRYTTFYMRQQFTITNAIAVDQHIMLRMDWDDGYIAWLDGNYLTNVNGAVTELANTAIATANHESSHGNANNSPQPAVTNDLGLASVSLGLGTHTLAIMGLNVSSGSSDFVQVPDLYLDTYTPPVPTTNVWYATNSPIVVNATVNVAVGSVLIIEPGVTVQFGSGVNLIVANGGQIIGEGNATNRIHFSSGAGVTAWGGITINGAVGSPETRLAYVDFDGNGTTCIEVAGGTLYLDHAVFGTTTHQYVSLDNSSFLLSSCVFPTCTTPAGFEPVHGSGGIKSGGRGIVRDSFFGSTTNYNDIMDFTGGNRPNQPILQYYRNVFIGASDDVLDLDGTDAWIEGNIFLHVHKNGSPDTASGISGGNNGSDTSEITIIGNIFYDCDQAATAKQGNFYTLINNTVVHQSHQGGVDTDGAVICLEDAGVAEAAGMYLEGNIIYDAEKLVRNLTNAIVTLTNNLMPFPWSGPGGGNSTQNPLLKRIPLVSETYFTNWAEAQVLRDWFSLQSNSPAIGTGPNGRDKGGVIPLGASISGEPVGTTSQTNLALTVGVNHTGHGIPTAGWPNGSGFTHYKWRLDTNTWSAETPISIPISLIGLSDGPHQVEISGKNDAGYYQDDPVLGPDAATTFSRAWNVQSRLEITSAERTGTQFILHFLAVAGNTYTVQYKDALSTTTWLKLSDVPAQPATADYAVVDHSATGETRFYRVVTPVQP